MQYAPTIFTKYYRSRVGMLTIICVDTYVALRIVSGYAIANPTCAYKPL